MNNELFSYVTYENILFNICIDGLSSLQINFKKNVIKNKVEFNILN